MVEKKVDRRVSRTRRVLRDALLSLILEKGYDGTSVEEITQRADVGRTTFYLHYRDKEELLLESINNSIAEFIEQVSQVPLSAWSSWIITNETPAPICLVFEHAAENADLYRVMLRGEGISRAQRQIRNTISEAVANFVRMKVQEEQLQIRPGVSLDFFANYFTGSLMGILAWWLETDMPYSPLEMAGMFQRMFLPGAVEVLGNSEAV